MKKLIFITMLAMLMAFCVGCGSDKTPITSEEFSTICEESGYVITDVTEQYSEYDYIKKHGLLKNQDYIK